MEYTFGEASSESQEVSKRDKEAKKPVTGEYISTILINLILHSEGSEDDKL